MSNSVRYAVKVEIKMSDALISHMKDGKVRVSSCFAPSPTQC